MLNKIKNYLIAAGAFFGIVAAAYFNGKGKGKQDEKIKNMENAQRNIAAALRARARLADPDYVRRLHGKYRR